MAEKDTNTNLKDTTNLITNIPVKNDTPTLVKDDEDAKAASDLITAAHNNSKQLALAIWKRVLELLVKLVGVKGLFFGVSTYLFTSMGSEKFSIWIWVLSGILLIGGTYADKIID